MNLPATSLSSPTTRPDDPLRDMLADSGPVSSGVSYGICAIGPVELEARISRAETYLAAHAERRVALMQALQPASMEETEKLIIPFPSAWPNAAGADLAGYGAQLAVDVVERQPCRYALTEGIRHLRQNARFLPSIAEVLESIDAAEQRVRATAYHIDRLPSDIAKARHELERMRRRVVIDPERLGALGVVEQP